VSPLAIRGWSASTGVPGEDPRPMFDDPLPVGRAPVLTGFDIRAHLGRKGTSFLDRATALAVVTAGAALRDAGVVADETRDRIGVVLGTTVGSLQATSDYSRETLVQEKPYLVNPVLFPNTVMNRAAGKVAIQFGLRGVNATVAGGPLALHHALAYAATMLERGHVDRLLVGAVEEFSPHRAWSTHLASGGELVAGEGAAVFLVDEGPEAPGVAGLATGFGWRDAAPSALAGCVHRALDAAGMRAADVSVVAAGDDYDLVTGALGRAPERFSLGAELGVCDAATSALTLAALLTRPGVALLTARSADGGVGALLLRSHG
jgi:3-oxoacyl-[acyl-carrier-protein] synthase II